MDKKYALVTGGNRGIGFEACRQLAKIGFSVILSSRDEQKGLQAVSKLKSAGLDILYHKLDVTHGDDVNKIVRFIEKEIGRLDVLINNAGVYLDEGRNILDIEDEVMKTTMDINLMGPFYLCRAIIPIMKKNKYGRIVNLSSGLGSISSMGGGTGAYKISKAALNALTRILAAEVDSRQIKVNSLSPGWVKTEMGGKHANRSLDEAAEGIVGLATLPEDGPTGGFFRDQKQLPW
jgi:NAD(P)-dependent dehydrogenase (short-subunit alcohol dehydrogenase family)